MTLLKVVERSSTSDRDPMPSTCKIIITDYVNKFLSRLQINKLWVQKQHDMLTKRQTVCPWIPRNSKGRKKTLEIPEVIIHRN